MSEDDISRQNYLIAGRRTPDSIFPISGDATSEYRRIEPAVVSSSVQVSPLEQLLKSRGLDIDELKELALREAVISKIASYLDQNYDNKVVAMTYDGKVIASADSDFELIKMLEQLPIPPSQIFMHKVGQHREGWA